MYCLVEPTISGGRHYLFREKGTEKYLSNAGKWEVTKHHPQTSVPLFRLKDGGYGSNPDEKGWRGGWQWKW